MGSRETASQDPGTAPMQGSVYGNFSRWLGVQQKRKLHAKLNCKGERSRKGF